MVRINDALKSYQAAQDLSKKAMDAGAKTGEGSFSDFLKDSMQEAVDQVKASEDLTAAYAVNKASLDQVVTAVNNAEVTLKAVVNIRDKLVSAYQEILRMPV